MSSTAQFKVTGKLSQAVYVFDTHSLLTRNQGNYPCFAAALFGPERPEEIYAFALVKCRVFPIDSKCTKFIHAFRVFLVTKTQHWIGCVGVAEYDREPNFENIDHLLNVDAHFTILPYEEKFVFYREEYWAACCIPLQEPTAKVLNAAAQDTDADAEADGDAKVGSKHRRLVGFEIPSGGRVQTVDSDDDDQQVCTLPVQVQHVRFPFPMDDLWTTDFFPLQLPSDEGTDWKSVDEELLRTRFWFLFREDATYPQKVFPSVFHKFALDLFLKQGQADEWIETVFGDANEKKIHGVAFARNALPPEMKSVVMQEWSKQSADPFSELNKFRFERFDFFFDRIGRPILQALPWGTYHKTWIFENPLLESTYREVFLWYVVDHCLEKGTPSLLENLHVRHAKRVYEEWDLTMLRDFMVRDLCSSQIEKKIWKEYKLLFLPDEEEPSTKPGEKEEDEEDGETHDWIFREFIPLLAKKLLREGYPKLSRKYARRADENRALRATIKRSIVRDIVRGKVAVQDYLE